MRKPAFLLLIALLWTASAPAETSAALTLEEAYRLALTRSEDIGIRQESINIAAAHFYRAFDVILPSVHYEYTNMQQDAPEGGGTDGTFTGNSFRRTTQGQKITFSQPLFSGFKEIAALQGAGAEKNQRRFEMRRAKHLLFIDVSEAYYALLQARKDEDILGEVRELMKKRQQELEERAKLGRSREAEVQSAVAELKLLEADLETARQVEILARQLMEFYIGRPLDEPLMDALLPAHESAKPDFAKLAEQRDDVRALREAKLLSDKNVLAAQSDLFPHVTLDGNYYTERVGFQRDIDWDLLLTIDVPIFDKFNTYADINVAGAQRKTAELLWVKQRRTAELEIRNAHEEYEASSRIEASLHEAAEASKKNYELQVEEYRSSLINNVQVLDTLRSYQEILRRYNDAQYQLKKDFWALRVAEGRSPVEEK